MGHVSRDGCGLNLILRDARKNALLGMRTRDILLVNKRRGLYYARP